MANNYQAFAAMFPFPEDAGRECARIVDALQKGDMDNVPECVAGMIDLDACGDDIAALECIYENGQLYISSGNSEYCDPEPACAILSKVMEKFDVRRIVTIESAIWCDKPRAGEFGGQACVVGPGDWDIMDTSLLAADMAQELGEKLGVNMSNPAPL